MGGETMLEAPAELIVEQSLESYVSALLSNGLKREPLYLDAFRLYGSAGIDLVRGAALIVTRSPQYRGSDSRYLIRKLRESHVHGRILVIGWAREGAARHLRELATDGADDVFLFDMAGESDRFFEQIIGRELVPPLNSALDIVATDVRPQQIRAIASWCVRNAYLRVSTQSASVYFDRDRSTVQRWFTRAGLPPVNDIIAAARLLHADFLRESLGWNAERTAEALGCDSSAALRMLRRRVSESGRRNRALVWLRDGRLE